MKATTLIASFKTYKTKSTAASVAARKGGSYRPAVDGSCWYLASEADWATYDALIAEESASVKPQKAKAKSDPAKAYATKLVRHLLATREAGIAYTDICVRKEEKNGKVKYCLLLDSEQCAWTSQKDWMDCLFNTLQATHAAEGSVDY